MNLVNWITGKIMAQGFTVAPRNPIALYRSTINTSNVSYCPGFQGAIRVLTAVRQVDKRLKRKIAKEFNIRIEIVYFFQS